MLSLLFQIIDLYILYVCIVSLLIMHYFTIISVNLFLHPEKRGHFILLTVTEFASEMMFYCSRNIIVFLENHTENVLSAN